MPPPVKSNSTDRVKLFEGLQLPLPPVDGQTPRMQQYFRELNDYLRRLADGISAGIITVIGGGLVPHHLTHENGGVDEISVLGLSGLLADQQDPLIHNIITRHNGFPGGATNFLREDGTWNAPASGSSGVTIYTIEIDFGSTPRTSGYVDFTHPAGGLVASDPVIIQQLPGPYTGKGTSVDEVEMDQLELSAYCLNTTTIRVWYESEYFVRGKYKCLYVLPGIAGTPNALRLEKWIRTTAGVLKTYVSTLDWRGRIIHISSSFYPGTIVNANLNNWTQYPGPRDEDTVARVGTSFNTLGTDLQIAQLSTSVGAAGGVLLLFIETGTGQLYVDSLTGGFTTEHQVVLVVDGYTPSSGADITI